MTPSPTPIIEQETKPRIIVFGLGGSGSNAVNNMIRCNLEGVDFIAANTDVQALQQCLAPSRVQIGKKLTKGLGAGSNPEIGGQAAEEQLDEINRYIEDANMVFITAGMGGGTGTGSASVIAQAANRKKILTVGIVTKPFHCEGQHRMRVAQQGIEQLQQYVDTLIVIPNQNLFTIIDNKTPLTESFMMIDNVLYSGVRSVTDLIIMPGLINLDFADLRTVMSTKGKALMGTGEGRGDSRAVTAAEEAISNPLLDQASLKGASSILINITGGQDLTLFEIDEAISRIRYEVDPQANIIFGSSYDASFDNQIRVSVIATGIDNLKKPEITVIASEPQKTPEGAMPSYHQNLTRAPVPEEPEYLLLERKEHDLLSVQPGNETPLQERGPWYKKIKGPIDPTVHPFPNREIPIEKNLPPLPDFLKANN